MLKKLLEQGFKMNPFQNPNLEEIVALTDKNGYEIAVFTEFRIKKNIERAIKNNALDPQKTFQNFKENQPFQKIIKQKATDFIKKNGWSFAILGQTGSGKSHICDSILIELIKKNYNAKKINWSEEINYLKFNQNQLNPFLSKLNSNDIIAIDDFWKTSKNTPPTDIEIEIGYMIINFCYNKKKKLIINSEKTIDQIRYFDQSIAGRLIEMTGDTLINVSLCDKKNYREVNDWSV